MAKKKQSTPAPAPSTPTPSAPKADTKAARREQNEAQRLANIERRKNGEPTPWEQKRAARAKARAAKQAAYKQKQDRIHERNRERDEREQRARDALAKDLLRQANKGKARRVHAAKG